MPLNSSSIMLRVATLALLLAPASHGQDTVQTAQSTTPISIRLTSNGLPVQPGSVIKLHVSIVNSSPETMRVDRSLGLEMAFAMYSVQIDTQQNGAATAVEYNRMLHSHEDHRGSRLSVFIEDVKPGGSYEEDISLAAIYDLSKPGEHGITVSREVEIKGKSVRITSNRITITIK